MAGAEGYWTDILGPYLKPSGHYNRCCASLQRCGKTPAPCVSARASRLKRIGSAPFHESTLGPGHFEIAPPGSADLVLTFRNFHNWMDEGYADKALAACFHGPESPAAFSASKNTAVETMSPQDPKAESGYVRQRLCRCIGQKGRLRAGGVFGDQRQSPRYQGLAQRGSGRCRPVWQWAKKDRDKYIAIGEGDNMVLKFQKPR